ncbi:hypothetical protein ACFYZB_45615 [Streptomyces sp. NPDC001852]|uniref:hypothetical protein n=1 Tax=Streptomyces sp. NPDC001852 TaxID=3364619 RepID=UPI0036A9C3FC
MTIILAAASDIPSDAFAAGSDPRLRTSPDDIAPERTARRAVTVAVAFGRATRAADPAVHEVDSRLYACLLRRNPWICSLASIQGLIPWVHAKQ